MQQCRHSETKRFGFYGRNKIQRYRCPTCKATFSQPRKPPLGRHCTPLEQNLNDLCGLCDGMYQRNPSAFTRLSLGFTKTLKHLKAAVNLYMALFNFCRVHKTLRVTPAMQLGLTDHPWTYDADRAEHPHVRHARQPGGGASPARSPASIRPTSAPASADGPGRAARRARRRRPRRPAGCP